MIVQSAYISVCEWVSYSVRVTDFQYRAKGILLLFQFVFVYNIYRSLYSYYTTYSLQEILSLAHTISLACNLNPWALLCTCWRRREKFIERYNNNNKKKNNNKNYLGRP